MTDEQTNGVYVIVVVVVVVVVVYVMLTLANEHPVHQLIKSRPTDPYWRPFLNSPIEIHSRNYQQQMIKGEKIKHLL